MAALWAEFAEPGEATDRRGSVRRTLRLVAWAAHDQAAKEVLILDLSTTGLMIETNAELSTTETIAVELPDADPILARVRWQRGAYYGCEFLKQAPVAAISAALLRSAPKPRTVPVALPAFSWETAFRDRVPLPKREPANEGLIMFVLLLMLVAVGTFMLALLSLPLSAR